MSVPPSAPPHAALLRYGDEALVLGSAEGLGAAWTDALAAAGFGLCLVDCAAERLEAQVAGLTARGIRARGVVLDLGAPTLAAELAAAFDAHDVGLVIYNACFSRPGAFDALSLDAKLRTLDVNARGPLVVCDWAVPRLRARGRGALVLVSSLSSMQGSAMVAPYAATKAFDTVLGASLWAELRGTGVDVLVVVAGAIRTPGFLSVTPEARRADAMPMEAEQVVAESLGALGRAGPLFVPGWRNRLVFTLLGLLPWAWSTRLISATTRRMFGPPG